MIILQINKKEQFEKYYDKYYYQVYKHILKKISDTTQAEDMAMESFLVCYQKFDTYDPQKASFATWLYVIVNNKIKNYYRDHKTYEDIDNISIPVDNFEDDLTCAIHLDDMRKHLADALSTLPEIQRKIVIYKYFKNKNSSEIAEIVGISSVNVRVNLSRALKKIKDYFEENSIEWEN